MAYSKRVQNIINFCELLTVPDGKYVGQKVKLSSLQKAFLNAVYGPRDAHGLRIVREALLTMARKNAKTATIAMLGLVHLCGPEAVPNAELYSVAYEKEQAAQVFRYMAAMIYANESLSAILNVVETQKKIRYPAIGSMYAALSRESKSKLGKSTYLLIFDEGAQYGQDRELLDAMITSQGAHDAPLTFYISTQAENDAAWFSELVDYGKKINAGEIQDPTFVAFIFETPPDADPFKEETWYLANPHLGTFKSLEYMRNMAKRAKESPSFLNAFRNLELNQRIAAEAPFIPYDVWTENSGKPDYSVFSLGRPVYAGLDLSSKNDLSALVLVCFDDAGTAHIMPYFWTPQDGLRERCRKDRVPYDLWIEQGFLAATPGRTVDYEYIARQIAELHEEFGITCIKFDRWKIGDLLRECERIGLDVWIHEKDKPVSGGVCFVPHGQGFKDMDRAVETLEDLLLNRRMRHGGHPVLTMCAANARVTRDPAENKKFDKIKSTGRIDGIVALAMAANVNIDSAPDDSADFMEFLKNPIMVNY